jgi:hypothetical protein
MNCAKCSKEVPVEETKVVRGQWLCEDCYIAEVQPNKPCDLKSFATGQQTGSYNANNE